MGCHPLLQGDYVSCIDTGATWGAPVFLKDTGGRSPLTGPEAPTLVGERGKVSCVSETDWNLKGLSMTKMSSCHLISFSHML